LCWFCVLPAKRQVIPRSPGTDPEPVVPARAQDPQSQITTLILDAVTANVTIYAIAAHAEEREAHLRKIQLHGRNLPERSCGKSNRELIADRCGAPLGRPDPDAALDRRYGDLLRHVGGRLQGDSAALFDVRQPPSSPGTGGP
jgi:hypothetical protein